MRRLMHLGIALSLGTLASPALAASIADPVATFQSADLGGGVFDYKITLTDSAASTSPAGTFWFAWVPGQDFLNSAPLSVTSPAGWTDRVTNGGAADGFAIQWVAGAGSAMAPGGSLQFEFTSTETPAQLLGNSPFYPGTPEGTSFLYTGAPFSDPGTQIQVAAASTVPEPPSLALSLISGVALIAYRKFGCRPRA